MSTSSWGGGYEKGWAKCKRCGTLVRTESITTEGCAMRWCAASVPATDSYFTDGRSGPPNWDLVPDPPRPPAESIEEACLAAGNGAYSHESVEGVGGVAPDGNHGQAGLPALPVANGHTTKDWDELMQVSFPEQADGEEAA